MIERDEKGRFQKGHSSSKEWNKKISEALIRRQKHLLSLNLPEPDFKRCNRCKKMKPVGEFRHRRHKRKSGVTVLPYFVCRVCERELHTERRRSLGIRPRARRLKQKSSGKKKHGRPVNQYSERVPIGPFRQWILEEFGGNAGALAREVGCDAALFRRILSGHYTQHGKVYKTKQVSVDLVDRALTYTNSRVPLAVLYPSLYE